MEDSKIVEKKTYKYCIVPLCHNSTIKTPHKLFFSVPKDDRIRRRWCSVMKRDENKNKKLSSTSSLFCCEDHFLLENDMENYWEYRLSTSTKQLRLKAGVVPHIFECQSTNLPAPERSCIKKRKRSDAINEALSESPLPSEQEESLVPTFVAVPSSSVEKHDIGVQVCIKNSVRSKGVTANISILCKNASTSPKKLHTKSIAIMTSPDSFPVPDLSATEEYDDDYVYVIEEDDSDNNYSSEEECMNQKFKDMMLNATTICIEKEPKVYLGLPEESIFIISSIARFTKLPVRDIYIVLKKIKLDPSFKILGIDFGMVKSQASRIFSKSLGKMAHFFKHLIFWPESDLIQRKLPIAFRARYGKVTSIIDCLEIEIEKPSDPFHQSLTWSQYYKCNTLKYLISCTPDGLINFISDGYGGRATDVAIVEDCDYLAKLKPGMHIMADRGFKHVSPLLQVRGCTLVRPPSVLATVQSTNAEVKQSKRIAALRIHVERVIGRLREFEMLLPHSCIDNKFVASTDDIITIACGIVNMQSNLTKI